MKARLFVNQCLAISCVCLFSCTTLAVNPQYDPHWSVGDTWQVRYVFNDVAHRSKPATREVISAVVDYTYTVFEQSGQGSQNVTKIRAESAEREDWVLVFDTANLTLLEIYEIMEGIESPRRHSASCKSDAHMADLDEYLSGVILDFPKLPDNSVDETRIIRPGGDQENYSQACDFEKDKVTVVLSRPGADPQHPHKTTIVWEPGAKWWKTAKIELGSTVIASGELITP